MHDADLSAWDFAVAVYGRPGVREACLALQDRRGADIVALLALLHRVADRRGVPSEAELRAALAQVAPWRDRAVTPLRTIRRALKGWRFGDDAADPRAESARQAVSAAELAAERVELETLSATLAAGGRALDAPALADGAKALALYWRVADLAADELDRRHLAALLAAGFSARTAEAARHTELAFCV